MKLMTPIPLTRRHQCPTPVFVTDFNTDVQHRCSTLINFHNFQLNLSHDATTPHLCRLRHRYPTPVSDTGVRNWCFTSVSETSVRHWCRSRCPKLCPTAVSDTSIQQQLPSLVFNRDFHTTLARFSDCIAVFPVSRSHSKCLTTLLDIVSNEGSHEEGPSVGTAVSFSMLCQILRVARVASLKPKFGLFSTRWPKDIQCGLNYHMYKAVIKLANYQKPEVTVVECACIFSCYTYRCNFMHIYFLSRACSLLPDQQHKEMLCSFVFILSTDKHGRRCQRSASVTRCLQFPDPFTLKTRGLTSVSSCEKDLSALQL